MIDWTQVTELRQEIGADDFGDVVEIFLEEVENEITALRNGCDKAKLQARLHLLKGSALSLGFQAFSRLCQRGESAAADGWHAQVDLPAILATFDASKAEFLSGLNGLRK